VVSGARVVTGSVSAVLDLIAMKPIAIFVWWLSNCANRIEFQERAELRRRVEAAARGITSGHLIEACWAECQLDREGSDGRDQDAQSIADAVRSRVASLMPGKPIRSREGG
jgi:hypothetical protein